MHRQLEIINFRRGKHWRWCVGRLFGQGGQGEISLRNGRVAEPSKKIRDRWKEYIGKKGAGQRAKHMPSPSDWKALSLHMGPKEARVSRV